MHHAALEHVPLQHYANPFASSGPAGGSVSVCVSVQNNLCPGQAVAPELSLVSLVITEKWLRTVIAHASLPWNAMTARYHDASSLQQRTLAQCTQQRCLGVYPFIGRALPNPPPILNFLHRLASSSSLWCRRKHGLV